MKYCIRILALCTILACSPSSDSTKKFSVNYEGALKNIMKKGEVSAQSNLANFQSTDHLYALGALENLKGEILIVDGIPYISTIKNQKLIITNSFEYKATLLVYCSVNKWNSLTIPNDVLSYTNFETYVENTAGRQGIDTTKPFPFMVEGIAASFDWHVIDWPEGDTIHSHEKHKKSGLYGTETNENVQMLGFYSKNHHAVFTHHSTNMHIHVKTRDNNLSGHLDGFMLGPGMTLKLPDIK